MARSIIALGFFLMISTIVYASKPIPVQSSQSSRIQAEYDESKKLISIKGLLNKEEEGNCGLSFETDGIVVSVRYDEGEMISFVLSMKNDRRRTVFVNQMELSEVDRKQLGSLIEQRAKVNVRGYSCGGGGGWHANEITRYPFPPSLIPGLDYKRPNLSDDERHNSNDAVYPMSASLRPKILYKEKAVYLAKAKEKKVQGTVVLNVVFTSDGHVTSFRVVRGLPEGLTEKAIEAAQKIRFIPAMKDGVPVSVRGNLEYLFNLY